MTGSSDSQTATISAFYPDHGAAESTVERLRSAGIPDDAIRTREERRSGERQGDPGPNGVLVSAVDLPPDKAELAREVFGGAAREDDSETAIDTPGGYGRATGEFDRLTGRHVGESPEAGTPDEDSGPGASGTTGGYGRATEEVDRLTGQPIGSAEPRDRSPADSPEKPRQRKSE